MKSTTVWKNCLQLNSDRLIVSGSTDSLCAAIKNAADLRIYTEFRHNEHIDIESDNSDLVQEVSEFPVTYLIDNSWSAGIMTWRQPIDLPKGFGPASMSFFMYNQDGQQAIARPFFDGRHLSEMEATEPYDFSKMKKYHQIDDWDHDTNAPSHNFIYDFEQFKYYVRDDWQELYSHDSDGNALSGSLADITDAFASGCEVKVGISGLCNHLTDNKQQVVQHELFVRTGAGYYYTDEKLFVAATYPLVRVAPAMPLVYASKNWDFGWSMVRTDGQVVQRICDPQTLQFRDEETKCALRWFVR